MFLKHPALWAVIGWLVSLFFPPAALLSMLKGTRNHGG